MPNDFSQRSGVSVATGRPATPSFAPSRSELELRAGIEPLDRLLHERKGLVNEVSELRAKFGPFGTHDALRKIELSRIKSLIRVQAMRDSRKMNNDQVDDGAHEHPDYVEFIQYATKERARYFRLEAAIEAIDFRIYRGQSLAGFAAAEVRMTR